MTAKSKSSSAFKPWPKPMVESKGDYREEAYLEDLIGGPLYTNQKSLLRLPVPKIEDTIKTFLPTALPLAESEEEKQSLIEACNAFPSEAAKLQERLIGRKEGDMKESSWLQLWWNTAGYLQVRDPVVVNVSYFFHFSDDGSLHLYDTGKSLGVMRGASILVATAQFRKLVCSGNLPCESIGKKDPKTPLCSAAFKYMFNSCRVPRREHDTYRMYDPSLFRHCVVACKGQFYTFDFIDENDDPLPLSVIEDRLQECVDMAEEEKDEPKLGILTSSDRDSWADARVELIRIGGSRMESALESLESGAILLCLDDEMPVSRKQCANIFWTGGLKSVHNRWFDKSIQIMCTKNGKAGLIGEHSMMDGMPVIGLADHITRNSYRDIHQVQGAFTVETAQRNEIKNIFLDSLKATSNSGSNITAMTQKAHEDFVKLITDHSLDVQNFEGYGSTYIKSIGYSPDAYVQMAIQLATFRLFHKQVGTYEATQMRPYLHGRTETTRAVSSESEEFVKCMGLYPKQDENDVSARKEKIRLLRAAVKSHVQYIGKAGKGNGVDRHFFGLSMLVENNEEIPSLFRHPLFIRSKTWRVSTSHLTHPKFDNWGFGEVVPDGVGVAYGIKSNSCFFNLAARKENGWTEQLSHFLEEALLELQVLNDMDKNVSSKL